MTGHKITSSALWKEFNWKLKMRSFRTPSYIPKYEKREKKLCWRNCKQIGDHAHIFWDCPKLKKFWQEVQAEILTTINVNLPLDPIYYLLGLTPKGDMGKREVHLIHILLLVMRKIITLSWLKPQTPTLNQWRERLEQVYLKEKITAKLHIKTDSFLALYAPVIAYFGWSDRWRQLARLRERKRRERGAILSIHVFVFNFLAPTSPL